MNKQVVVCTWNGWLFSYERKWSTDTCYNIDELHKHDTKWKKLNTKGPTLCNSIYMKYPEQINPYKQNTDWWLPGVEERGKWGRNYLLGREFDCGVMEMLWNETEMVAQHCECTKCHW